MMKTLEEGFHFYTNVCKTILTTIFILIFQVNAIPPSTATMTKRKDRYGQSSRAGCHPDHIHTSRVWGWEAWQVDADIQLTFPVLSGFLFSLHEGWVAELAASCPCVVAQPPDRREDILNKRHLFSAVGEQWTKELKVPPGIPCWGDGKAEVPAPGGTWLPRRDFIQLNHSAEARQQQAEAHIDQSWSSTHAPALYLNLHIIGPLYFFFSPIWPHCLGLLSLSPLH